MRHVSTPTTVVGSRGGGVGPWGDIVEEIILTGTGRDCHNRRAGVLGTGNSDNVSGVLLQV